MKSFNVRAGIVVKYLGPTTYKSARVKAISQAGSLIKSIDDRYCTEDNMIMVAEELVHRLGWTNTHTHLEYGWSPTRYELLCVLVKN
jgi:hypothetical protein